MDLRDRPEDEAFRKEIRAWLADHVVGEYAALGGRGGSGDETFGFETRLEWEKVLAADRWTGIGWPVEHGGRGATIAHQVIFNEEYVRARAPGRVSVLGEGLLGPTIIQYGTPEQRARFLPPILAGTELWCQGYSEPNAGSDLANVKTRAVRDGDEWVVSGQKVWTSLAHQADWCFVVGRTDPDSSRHKGLSYLLVPMDQPGVQVRPIKQINGEQDFCEVWFQDAVTPIDQVVGAVNEGWAVTMSALSYERSLHLLQRQLRYRKLVRELECATDWAAAGEAAQDALVDVEIAGLALAFAMDDQLAALEGGSAGGGGLSAVDANTSKVYWSESYRRLSELGADLALAGATGSSREWIQEYYSSLATTIYAGTNEIQRNIIAERGLGLPR